MKEGNLKENVRNPNMQYTCSDPVVVHTAVTTSVVPRSIGGWEWTETDRSDSTT